MRYENTFNCISVRSSRYIFRYKNLHQQYRCIIAHFHSLNYDVCYNTPMLLMKIVLSISIVIAMILIHFLLFYLSKMNAAYLQRLVYTMAPALMKLMAIDVSVSQDLMAQFVRRGLTFVYQKTINAFSNKEECATVIMLISKLFVFVLSTL